MSGSSGRSIRIAILAMGGEGGGVLADWIVGTAEANGYIAQLTSVPGVAQRTGATNYYIEIFPYVALPAGRGPVLALTPSPGDVDIVIASELMEAGRAIQRGIVTPDRTTLITSTARVFAMNERLALGDGRVEGSKIIEACRVAALRLVALDLAAIATKSGSVISAAMLGALAGARTLPFERAAFEDAIKRGGVGIGTSLKAFGMAHDAAMMNGVAKREAQPPPSAGAIEPPPAARELIASAVPGLPEPVREIATEGIARVVDYQDAAYARLYIERLETILAADVTHGDDSFRLSTETARWLALGMAYEDTIRVAELKIRAARFDRVRKEVRARDDQIVEVAEFLHPRLQEIAESVPAPLGRFLLNNQAARGIVNAMTSSGRVVATTSIRGFLLMAAVASLKPRRRASLRFLDEQRQLEAWLTDVAAFATRSYGMALEIAECRRLVKGYGDTHERGRRSYAAIIRCAHAMPVGDDAAAHIAMLRAAALDDETGTKLEACIALLGMQQAGTQAHAEAWTDVS